MSDEVDLEALRLLENVTPEKMREIGAKDKEFALEMERMRKLGNVTFPGRGEDYMVGYGLATILIKQGNTYPQVISLMNQLVSAGPECRSGGFMSPLYGLFGMIAAMKKLDAQLDTNTLATNEKLLEDYK